MFLCDARTAHGVGRAPRAARALSVKIASVAAAPIKGHVCDSLASEVCMHITLPAGRGIARKRCMLVGLAYLRPV